jgi:alpha-ketoglutarate-dependent taurine dioxygenase
MGMTTLDVQPLNASFGAIVRGIKLASLDDETWAALHETWLEYALLIFPGQFLTKDEQNSFARRFGNLEFEAVPISNIDKDGNVHADPADDIVKSLRGNEGWHHDSTCLPGEAKGAVFSAEIVPSEGATGWADMRAAMKRSTKNAKPRRRPLTRTTRCTTARAERGICRRSATKAANTAPTATTTWSRRCGRS